jgi:hypothetical protein
MDIDSFPVSFSPTQLEDFQAALEKHRHVVPGLELKLKRYDDESKFFLFLSENLTSNHAIYGLPLKLRSDFQKIVEAPEWGFSPDDIWNYCLLSIIGVLQKCDLPVVTKTDSSTQLFFSYEPNNLSVTLEMRRINDKWPADKTLELDTNAVMEINQKPVFKTDDDEWKIRFQGASNVLRLFLISSKTPGVGWEGSINTRNDMIQLFQQDVSREWLELEWNGGWSELWAKFLKDLEEGPLELCIPFQGKRWIRFRHFRLLMTGCCVPAHMTTYTAAPASSPPASMEKHLQSCTVVAKDGKVDLWVQKSTQNDLACVLLDPPNIYKLGNDIQIGMVAQESGYYELVFPGQQLFREPTYYEKGERIQHKVYKNSSFKVNLLYKMQFTEAGPVNILLPAAETIPMGDTFTYSKSGCVLPCWGSNVKTNMGNHIHLPLIEFTDKPDRVYQFFNVRTTDNASMNFRITFTNERNKTSSAFFSTSTLSMVTCPFPAKELVVKVESDVSNYPRVDSFMIRAIPKGDKYHTWQIIKEEYTLPIPYTGGMYLVYGALVQSPLGLRKTNIRTKGDSKEFAESILVHRSSDTKEESPFSITLDWEAKTFALHSVVLHQIL